MCEQHQINCDLTYFLGRTVHGGQKKKRKWTFRRVRLPKIPSEKETVDEKGKGGSHHATVME